MATKVCKSLCKDALTSACVHAPASTCAWACMPFWVGGRHGDTEITATQQLNCVTDGRKQK